MLPLGPVYHLTVYGDVPPDHDPVRVMLWLRSIEGFVGVRNGIDRVGLTVKVEE